MNELSVKDVWLYWMFLTILLYFILISNTNDCMQIEPTVYCKRLFLFLRRDTGRFRVRINKKLKGTLDVITEVGKKLLKI